MNKQKVVIVIESLIIIGLIITRQLTGIEELSIAIIIFAILLFVDLLFGGKR